MIAKLPIHLRMPQRSVAVAGIEPQPGHLMTPLVKCDPRTASQDPVIPNPAKCEST
jgi:hypothetical protein